ncbi:MFS transporter [Qipengyuania atrilutea]|uniref:MFS transporter n=1 Tax=Qipengyuania atrilutea TaxID=2744473 RepID=A0A850HD54_9SPHN|nr:MFS transporter [Actirhodobacter atriluteus]NVD45069.1 MFS transporter [Actirhodobacter atriluteus]
MIGAIGNIRTILLAIFMIMAGSGFLSTLIAVRLETAGTAAPLIGLVGTAYFAGLTLGALRAGKVVSEVGHIRSIAAFVSVFSASSLSYALWQDVGFWTVLRFLDGFAMAGIFVCLESWLGDRTDSKTRSSALAAYMVALYLGQALGQFLLTVGREAPALPFMFSAILLSLALVPVVLTKTAQPSIADLKALPIKRLYAISPLGVVGTTATGVMLGAFYALGAVFVRRMGLSLADVAFFTSCAIGGGVLLQWPLGMLSDRFDRRLVLVATMFAATLVCGALVVMADMRALLFPLAALFGGLSFALYPLCVAHTNDHVGPEERVGASGGLVLLYSVGAVAGPLLASTVMLLVGPAGLFAAIGGTALLATAFGLWRIFASKAVPEDEQGTFQSLPRTTALAVPSDTNGEE